jgi:hypothetical protein
MATMKACCLYLLPDDGRASSKKKSPKGVIFCSGEHGQKLMRASVRGEDNQIGKNNDPAVLSGMGS